MEEAPAVPPASPTARLTGPGSPIEVAQRGIVRCNDVESVENNHSLLRVRVADLLLVFALSLAPVPLLVFALTGKPFGFRLTEAGHLAFMLAHYGVALATVYFLIVRGRAVSWAELGFRSTSRWWFVWAVLIAICSVLLVAMAAHAIRMPAQAPSDTPLSELIPSGVGALWFLPLLGALAPISEEILFRGLLFGWMRDRLGIGPGVVLSALAFYLAHFWSLQPLHLVLGVVLALLYERSGSLWPAIVLHGTFNLAAVFAVYVGSPPTWIPHGFSALL